MCCSCCNPQIDPVVFPTLYFFSPVCYCRPMGSKSWVSGIPKEERRPVFGTRQYTKFFLSSQNFSPPFSLHSLSLSFSFCVCVCPRPVSVYSDGKRRLSFATLVMIVFLSLFVVEGRYLKKHHNLGQNVTQVFFNELCKLSVQNVVYKRLRKNIR